MPELPEVETIVRDIRPDLEGRRLRRVRVHRADVLRGVTARTVVRRLTGARIKAVTRRAKNAVLELDDRWLVVQPGMTGSLQVHPRPPGAEDRRYAVLEAGMEGGGTLIYRDVRRLGRIYLLDRRGWTRHSDQIGPEPLDPEYSADQFAARLRRSRQAIKKVIMDQRVLAGVGNIYANEALFSAGLDPSKPADHVGAEAAAALHAAIRRILAAAIDAEGTTVRDYRTGTGQPGNFQLALDVYGREGEPCRRCGTRLSGTHEIDARATVFCHRCQS